MKTRASNERLEREIRKTEEFWAVEAPRAYAGWSWMKVPEQFLDELDSYHRFARLKLKAPEIDWDSDLTRLGVRDAVDGHSHLEGYPETPGQVEELAGILDRAGIRHIVSLSLYKFWDDFLRELETGWLAGPLAGRVLPFVGFDWKLDEPGYVERACAHLDRVRSLGVRGVKVHKNVGLSVRANGKIARLTDSRFKEIFGHAGEIGLPVWVHYGDPYDFFLPSQGNQRLREITCFPDWHNYPKNLHERNFWRLHEDFFRLVGDLKGTNFVAVHLANYPWDRIEEFERLLLQHPNLYSDTSGRLAEIGRGRSLESRQNRKDTARRLLTRCQDKIIWGTDILPTDRLYKLWSLFLRSDLEDLDYTWATFYPGQGDWLVDCLALEKPVLDKLCRDVARGLLNLED